LDVAVFLDMATAPAISDEPLEAAWSKILIGALGAACAWLTDGPKRTVGGVAGARAVTLGVVEGPPVAGGGEVAIGVVGPLGAGGGEVGAGVAVVPVVVGLPLAPVVVGVVPVVVGVVPVVVVPVVVGVVPVVVGVVLVVVGVVLVVVGVVLVVVGVVLVVVGVVLVVVGVVPVEVEVVSVVVGGASVGVFVVPVPVGVLVVAVLVVPVPVGVLVVPVLVVPVPVGVLVVPVLVVPVPVGVLVVPVLVVPVLVVRVAVVLAFRWPLCRVWPVLVEVVCVMLSTLLVIVPARCASSRAVAGEAITTADDRPAPKATLEARIDTRRPVGTSWPAGASFSENQTLTTCDGVVTSRRVSAGSASALSSAVASENATSGSCASRRGSLNEAVNSSRACRPESREETWTRRTAVRVGLCAVTRPPRHMWISGAFGARQALRSSAMISIVANRSSSEQ
jgi:hypothetical protein